MTIAKVILRSTDTLKPGAWRERRLSKKEAEGLFGWRTGNIFEFAVETALRRGELARVRLADRDGAELFIPYTKNNEARTIPLSLRAREILDELDVDPNEPAFGYESNSITHLFREARVDLGFENLRLHDLRHEATSRLFEKGWTIPQVAVVTGHRDWRSLKRYTQIRAGSLLHVMDSNYGYKGASTTIDYSNATRELES